MDEQRERSKEILSQLAVRWDKHAKYYGDVSYCAAMVKSGESWQTAVLFLCPSKKGDIRDKDNRADYGDLLIVRGSFPLDEAYKTLAGVIERGIIELPRTPPVEMNVYLNAQQVRRHGSQDRRFPVHYSAYEYGFQALGGAERPNVPRGFVCAPDLPIYPHVYAAIEHQLGIRVINQGTSEIAVAAPDYRAKVNRVRLSINEVTVEVEAIEESQHDILGKVFHEDRQGRSSHHDLTFTNGAGSFSVPGHAKQMMVVLMSRSGGEVIDEWFYNSGIQAFGNFGMPANLGAEIEANEQNLESLIDGGESETLEFKEKLPPALTLAKTISGFANSGGGYLVIGVNDSGEVVGYEADKLADRLTNIVHDNCDPAPSFTAAPSAVRGMSVFVVTVAEGNDKPYVLKDNGVYIRAGATTRRANRYEMDRLYAGKQPGSRSWQ